MTALIAFHGDEQVKADLLARIDAHYRADEITQGVYWERGKGCAVGCMTHDPDGGHEKFPELWGIPAQIAYLADSIFENLPAAEAKKWPRRLIEAIPVGADLTRVWDRWAAWMLADLAAQPDALDCVRAMADLFHRAANGDEPSEQEWTTAARGAWAAWDAWTAWGAWDARAAWAARDAWTARAARGAWAAWDARAAWAARDAHDARTARAAWAARTARAARAAWAAWDARAAWAARDAVELLTILSTSPAVAAP